MWQVIGYWDGETDEHIFHSVPYAAPPVGPNR
jgi:carboxylesterase type B